MWALRPLLCQRRLPEYEKERNRHQGVHNMNNYMRLVEITLYLGAISLPMIPQSRVIDSLFMENDVIRKLAEVPTM
jgi:hypothetical protein